MPEKISYLLLSVAIIILIAIVPNGFASDEYKAHGKAKDTQASSYTKVVEDIGITLNRAVETYKKGDSKKAKGLISEAYFDYFEEGGLEGAIGARSPSKKASLESYFAKLIGLIGSHRDVSEVKAVVDRLMSELSDVALSLEEDRGTDLFSLFVNSLIIILREGFEAILIISALASYLIKIGKDTLVKTVYKGAFFAILASILVAVIFQFFFSAAGSSREAIEGITLMIATGVLFYVSYWLISKTQVARWQTYIKSKVEGSLSKGNIFALGFAAFLAVFREGAETVLFYQALYSSANGGLQYLLAGLMTGAVILVGIFFLFRYGSVRIPLGPFFAVTSSLLYYLAFTFAGKGILELQGAGLVSTTPLRGFPTIPLLGVYPSLEGIVIQLILILALLVAVVYGLVLKPYWESERRLKEVSHISFDISQLHESLDHIRQHARLCQELSPNGSNKEVREMRSHLKEIDIKVHEVMEHMHRLEGELSDIFRNLENTVKRR